MEIEGKVIQDLGIQSGTSKAGNPWKKREMIIETLDKSFPKKIKVTIFGEQRVDSINLIPGNNYILSVDIESREFNGRWYTDVNVYSSRESASTESSVNTLPNSFDSYNNPIPANGVNTPPMATYEPTNEGPDDLPF